MRGAGMEEMIFGKKEEGSQQSVPEDIASLRITLTE